MQKTFFHPLIEDTENYEKVNSHNKGHLVTEDLKKKPEKTHKDIKVHDTNIIKTRK